jgi:hypothetical protein
MSSLSLAEMQKILNGGYSKNEVAGMFPDEWQNIEKQLEVLFSSNDPNKINDYVNKVKRVTEQWKIRAAKSGNNPSMVRMAFPYLLRGKIVFMAMEEHMQGILRKANESRKDTLGFFSSLIVHRVMRLTELTRRPLALGFLNRCWRFVADKRTALALLGKKGMYCVYTKEFVALLKKELKGRRVLEIGAGNGLMARFLKQEGVDIVATDDYSWLDKIVYGDNVEKLAAADALAQHQPEVVLVSWPPPNNDFEKHVFKTPSVKTYIVVGCSLEAATGNRKSYSAAEKIFRLERSEVLAAALFPAEIKSEVLIFNRK